MITLILPLSTLFSQTEMFNEEWRWVHFTTETGLPSDKVYDVVETSNGKVWAVTAGGLAWYDGFKWHAIQDTSAIFHKRPHWVVPDLDGGLLMIIDDLLYKGNEYHIKHIPVKLNNEDVHMGKAIQVEDSIYLIQIGAANYTIHVYSFSHNVLKPLSLEGGPSGVGDYFYTSSGSVWLNTPVGLYRLVDQQWRLKLKSDNGPLAVKNVIEGKYGKSLVSITGIPIELRGLWEWDRDGRRTHLIKEGKDAVQSMSMSLTGEEFVVYESGDIRISQGKDWRSLNYVPFPLRKPLFLKYSDNNDVWVGTETGLYLFRQSLNRWTFWKHQFPSLYNDVNEIMRTRDGSIWLATTDGIEIRKPNGSVENITNINGRKIFVVTGLCEDDSGNVWISSGSMFAGTYRWDGNKWKHFGRDEGLLAPRVHKIRKDNEGRIWFLGLGLNTVSSDSQQPGTFLYSKGKFTRWGTEEGLLSGRVYSFSQTTDSALWFGTFKGLSRWKNGMWKHWKLSQDISTIPFTISVDNLNKMWFGNRWNELGNIDEQDNVQYITASNGLMSNSVWDLKYDGRGTLWFATRGGVSSYHDSTFSTFSLSSGLNSLKIWPLLPVEDRLYIGTEGNGVNILSFEEAKNPRPRVEIDKPVIEDGNALFHWRAYAYWGELPQQEIQTRFKINDKSWSNWSSSREAKYTDLSLGDNTFQVQAKGLFGYYDSLGQRVTFTVLPPFYFRIQFVLPMLSLMLLITFLGVNLTLRKRRHAIALRDSEARLYKVTETTSSAIFIFENSHIRYINSGAMHLTGYTKDELLSMKFFNFIHPEFHELVMGQESRLQKDDTLPHRCEVKIVTKDGNEHWIDCTLGKIDFQGLPGVIATAYEITDRKEGEEKLRSLASQLSLTEERERRRIAASLHDTISQTLAFCQIKLATLKSAQSVAERAALTKDINFLLEQSIEHAHSLTMELSPPALYELSFEDAIRWLGDSMSDQHKLKIHVNDDGTMKQIGEDIRVVLFQSVREALVNVVKHSQAKSVTISIQKNNDTIKIFIEDDGIGFNLSSIANGNQKKGGFGLFNVRERLVQLGGKFDITSEQGKGTSVVMVAPSKTEQLVSKGN